MLKVKFYTVKSQIIAAVAAAIICDFTVFTGGTPQSESIRSTYRRPTKLYGLSLKFPSVSWKHASLFSKLSEIGVPHSLPLSGQNPFQRNKENIKIVTCNLESI